MLPHSEVANLRDDIAPDRLDPLEAPDIREREHDVLRSGIGELAEAVHDLARALVAPALTADPDVLERRPLDLVRVPAHALTVRPEDLVLAVDPGRATEDVAAVGVLRHQPERLPLPAAADHDRDAWPADRLRRVEEPCRVDVVAVECALRAALALEHRVGDAERVLEQLEPHAERRELEPEASRLLLVPRRPDAEPRPAAGQHVERRRRLGPQPGLAVMDAADHQPEPGATGVRGEEAKRCPALEHRIRGRPDAADLEEVVHDPDRIEAGVVGGTSDPRERRCDRLRATGPIERWDLQTDLHRRRVGDAAAGRVRPLGAQDAGRAITGTGRS